MPDAHPFNTDTSLRGPFLAAHRALRKAVDAGSAELKGECSAAAWELRQNGENAEVRERLTNALRVSQELKKALTEFGAARLIPEVTGFMDYLIGQRTLVSNSRDQVGAEYLACVNREAAAKGESPDSDLRHRADMRAAWSKLEAREEFARLFAGTFGPVLVLLAPLR